LLSKAWAARQMTERSLHARVVERGTDASVSDLYLSPHSDDICFSLGGLAEHRRAGTLLTILPISGYVPTPPGAARPPADQVTRTRKAEDEAFAAACGLRARFLNMRCASLLGRGSRDLSWAGENADRIEPVLMKAVMNAAARSRGVRPWLFCPSGIGGHVDHVAIRMGVVRHLDRLNRYFRIAFYEDLHYASHPIVRSSGIARLLQDLPRRSFRRHVLPLGEGVAAKLALIRLYASQFLDPPQSIASFTPAMATSLPPHEAIWTEEPTGPDIGTSRA
jgi:LmbE family N-acetylglucosaminyl deacetylase